MTVATTRNGMESSHKIGQATRSNSASGQLTANNMAQRSRTMTVFMQNQVLVIPRTRPISKSYKRAATPRRDPEDHTFLTS